MFPTKNAAKVLEFVSELKYPESQRYTILDIAAATDVQAKEVIEILRDIAKERRVPLNVVADTLGLTPGRIRQIAIEMDLGENRGRQKFFSFPEIIKIRDRPMGKRGPKPKKKE